MIFEKITSSTLEESKKSKLELYEDIMNIKNYNTNVNNNLKFQHSKDYSNYTNVSSENNNDNNDKE